jgi:hypothetical protein
MSQDVDYIAGLEEDAKKASGGGGIISLCELNRGYKVFVSGMDNRTSFFPFAPGDEAGKKLAESNAKKHGKPQDSIEIIVYKDSVKGREVTWKDDRFFTCPLWTPGFKEVVMPHIKEARPPIGKKFWGKVGFTVDPSGRTKADQQGEQKPELIAFIAQVYANEAEATADAGSTTASANGTEPNDPMRPADYSAKDWADQKVDMVNAVSAVIAIAEAGAKSKPVKVRDLAIANAKTATIKNLAEQYAATEEQVLHLLNS